MFTEDDLLAIVYLVLYLRKGEDQSGLIQKLKGYGSKPVEDIDECSDECFTYDLIDDSVFDLTEKPTLPSQIDQLLEKVEHVKKQDAFAALANMPHRKRMQIAKCLDGSYVSEDAEAYFQDCCESLNVPMSLQNGEIILPKKKVYSIKCGTGTYCFASRKDAEEGAKILLDDDLRPNAQSFFQIREEMRPVDCHIWTLSDLDAKMRQLDREWYAQPAFIAADPEVWLENMVKTKIRNQGLLSASTSDNPKSSQKTGCLVPLVLCMTGLFLSCAVIAIGVFVASNI